MADIVVAQEGRVSAQVPVNTRVSASAKQVRALLKDIALPEIASIISSNDTDDKLKVRAVQSLLAYSVQLESLVEDHLTKRMSIELQAFGANVKAMEMPIVDEEEDLSPEITSDIIDF